MSRTTAWGGCGGCGVGGDDDGRGDRHTDQMLGQSRYPLHVRVCVCVCVRFVGVSALGRTELEKIIATSLPRQTIETKTEFS